MSNKKFSQKYKQKLLYQHLIGGIAVLFVIVTGYVVISIVYENNFYNSLQRIIGRELTQIIHDYEPAVIPFVIAVLELLVWIAIEWRASRKIMKIIDSMDSVIDNSVDTVVLPAEFSDLQNWLNLLKAQNRAQRHLEEMEIQKKSDSLTYLAHDIRTPLASVVGYLSLLCEAPDLPGEQRCKYIQTAFDKARQFEKLIDDFFDITRYNLSETALNKKEVDLCVMLEQLSDEFYPILCKKEIQLNLNIPDSLIILADGEKIARVFNNLIKNAVLYSYPETTIEISLENCNDTVTVVIKSHGKTIPGDKLLRIFDRFYRADETYQGNAEGTGLGLAIAKEIMRMHDGAITAESEDEVTTFTVSLPVVNE